MLLLAAILLSDTLRILPAAAPITFDGRASVAEYGDPSLEIPRPGGKARIWLRRAGDRIIIAALIPDTSWSWSDDFVISLDTRGDRAATPQHDDFQWDFRRVLDSSVIQRGEGGTWRMPRFDPDWRLGAAREGGGWEVRSDDSAAGWSIEIQLDPAYFAEAGDRLPGIAFRIFDNHPQGWFTWPAPTGLPQPVQVERRPVRWMPVSP